MAMDTVVVLADEDAQSCRRLYELLVARKGQLEADALALDALQDGLLARLAKASGRDLLSTPHRYDPSRGTLSPLTE